MNRAAWRSLCSVYHSLEGQQAVQTWCTSQLDRWALPHQRHFVPTSAGSTHVVTTSPDPPTVVVVPGTNFNAALYEVFAAALAPQRSTLLIDLPGQPGLSVAYRARRDQLAWYGRWLADVLDQTVSEEAIVVGHSLGGAIALACNSPRIAGRVLVSPGGLARLAINASTMRATLPWMLRPTNARSAALVQQFLAPGHMPPASLIEWFTLVGQNCRTSLAPPLLPNQLLAQRRSAQCHVATGQHDVFLPPGRLRRPAAQKLGVDLRVIPDAGHLVTHEQPNALAALVEEICRRRGSVRPAFVVQARRPRIGIPITTEKFFCR